LPHYEKVYNFDIEDNENYYVTEDGILVHNGYNNVDEIAEDATDGNRILDGEGNVGTYRDLRDNGSLGDNITPHHMSSDAYMSRNNIDGYTRNDGISMNMEHPHPGVGGRHRQTATNGSNITQAQTEDYWNLIPRDALAHDIRDARRIYQEQGLYNENIRNSFLEVIKQNQTKDPGAFGK